MVPVRGQGWGGWKVCLESCGAHFMLDAANSKPYWAPGLVLGTYCPRWASRLMVSQAYTTQVLSQNGVFGGFMCCLPSLPEDF